MDLDHSLKHMKEQADDGLLRDVAFTADMQQAVLRQISKPDRTGANGRHRWKWLGGFGAAVCACLVFFGLVPSSGPELAPPPAVADRSLWQPSATHTAPFADKTFSYLGEKPVRVITSDMYEKQGQKAMFLLNGSFETGERVQLVGEDQQGERIDLGRYAIGSSLYDAEGHFPTSITLPKAGLWKIEVRYRNEVLGNVYLSIQAGVAPSNKELVEPLITRFLQETDDFAWIGAKRRVSLELLGVDCPDPAQRIVYAKVSIEAEQPNGAAVSAPMKFNIVYQGGDYRVIDYQMPRDGNQHWNDILTIFPAEIVDKLKAGGHNKQE